MGEVIRARRRSLGLSQGDLATAAGVDKRQIRRYETGEQQPLFSVALAIADELGVSVGELAGRASQHVDLSGVWWMSWQTSNEGEEVITYQEVNFRQEGELLQLDTVSRGNVTLDEGGYNWRGELKIWGNEVLMGWYAADDGAVRSKGTLYFALHTHGSRALGRWVGMSYDGDIITGWGSLAHTEEEARAVIDQLKSI